MQINYDPRFSRSAGACAVALLWAGARRARRALDWLLTVPRDLAGAYGAPAAAGSWEVRLVGEGAPAAAARAGAHRWRTTPAGELTYRELAETTGDAPFSVRGVALPRDPRRLPVPFAVDVGSADPGTIRVLHGDPQNPCEHTTPIQDHRDVSLLTLIGPIINRRPCKRAPGTHLTPSAPELDKTPS